MSNKMTLKTRGRLEVIVIATKSKDKRKNSMVLSSLEVTSNLKNYKKIKKTMSLSFFIIALPCLM